MDIERVISQRSTDAKICLPAKGRASEVLKWQNLLSYIDMRMKAIFHNVNYGLEYEKIERCTVEESVQFITNRPTREYDITESSMFLAKITFRFNNQKMVKYFSMPYVKDKIFIYISGIPYIIIDVLSDKIISPGLNGVFTRFLKNKINIPSLKYSIRKSGMIKSVTMPHTEALNRRDVEAAPKVPVLWYLLVKYGFKDTMRMLHPNTKVKLINKDEVLAYRKNKKWTVYSTGYDNELTSINISRKTGGRTRRKTDTTAFISRYKYMNGNVFKDRVATEVYVAVEDQGADVLMDQTVASLYYVLDIQPDILAEEMYNEDVIHYTMANIIFRESGGKVEPNVLRRRLDDKLGTLDGHVDGYMQKVLDSEFGDTLGEDFSVDGFYKVLKAIYIRYRTWKMSSQWIVSNVIDKRFKILDYLTVPFFQRVNTMSFSLTQQMVNKGVPPESRAIATALNTNLTVGIMYGIRSGTPSCMRVSYGGDSIYHKYTSTLHLQFNVPCSTGNRSAKRQGVGARIDPVTLVQETHPYVGTTVAITKSRDTALKYLNLFAPFDPVSNTIIPDEGLLKRSSYLEKVLRRMPTRSQEVEVPPEFKIPYAPIKRGSE